MMLFLSSRKILSSRTAESAATLSGAGFSLWVLVLARTNPRRLKPAPLVKITI
jgi:hypothetical protein